MHCARYPLRDPARKPPPWIQTTAGCTWPESRGRTMSIICCAYAPAQSAAKRRMIFLMSAHDIAVNRAQLKRDERIAAVESLLMRLRGSICVLLSLGVRPAVLPVIPGDSQRGEKLFAS